MRSWTAVYRDDVVPWWLCDLCVDVLVIHVKAANHCITPTATYQQHLLPSWTNLHRWLLQLFMHSITEIHLTSRFLWCVFFCCHKPVVPNIFTQRCSVAKSVECFQPHLFVCLFVNTITLNEKHRMMKLGVGALYKNVGRVRKWGHRSPLGAHPQKCGTGLWNWDKQCRLPSLCVCLFVCLFVNTISSNRVNVGRWNFWVDALYKNLGPVQIWGS